MNKNVYVVYDRVAQDTIGVLMTYAHDAPAVRAFTDGLSDPTTLGRHPEDFDLTLIGTLHTGDDGFQLEGLEEPVVILSGRQWAASQPRQEN